MGRWAEQMIVMRVLRRETSGIPAAYCSESRDLRCGENVGYCPGM